MYGHFDTKLSVTLKFMSRCLTSIPTLEETCCKVQKDLAHLDWQLVGVADQVFLHPFRPRLICQAVRMP